MLLHFARMRALSLVAAATLGGSLAFVACGGSSSSRPVAETDAGRSALDDGGVVIEDDGGKSSGGCSDAAKLVYVVTVENDLYSFDPATLKFKKVGRLNCDSPSGITPNSMAIDRQAVAWVNYSDGSLFKVSTADATCEATTFALGQHGFGRLGMGFSTNGKSTDETLFVVGIENNKSPIDTTVRGQGLASVDLKSMILSPIGDFTNGLEKTAPELTGTGDGRLYGFFTTKPARLGAIEKSTAATPQSDVLTGVETGAAWAFSFWGGDFWFYTADVPTNPFAPLPKSKVTRKKASGDGSISVVVPDAGFRIVGAGVSTCAPIGPIL